MTGYQMAILCLIGCKAGDKYRVQSVDRWYADAVADLFPASRPFRQRQTDKQDTWRIASSTVDYSAVSLSAVTDWIGFCRGVIELQGVVDLWPHRTRRGVPIRTLRMRVYGQPDLLQAVMEHLPAPPKKIQDVRTNSGCTYAIMYQSPREVLDILDTIYGTPANEALWAKWRTLIQGGDD